MKSIFKQKVYRRVFGVKQSQITTRGTPREYWDLCGLEEFIEEKTICTTEDVEQILNKGDSFHVNILDKTVTICDKSFSDNGDVIYFVEDKFVKDEKSERSYEISSLKCEIRNLKSDVSKAYSIINDYKGFFEKKKPLLLLWYKKIFGGKK